MSRAQKKPCSSPQRARSLRFFAPVFAIRLRTCVAMVLSPTERLWARTRFRCARAHQRAQDVLFRRSETLAESETGGSLRAKAVGSK